MQTSWKFKTKKKIIFTSSIQANLRNEYGVSKKKSEEILKKFSQLTKSYVTILRLPNIYGKFCKPNYNSVVSTFCHNINTGKNIIITNPKKKIQLLYVDDLVDKLIELINKKNTANFRLIRFSNYNSISLKQLSDQLYDFKNTREKLLLPKLNTKFQKNLYSTFVTYIPTKYNCYNLKNIKDYRGDFIELAKSKNQGQFSFFSIKPGETRGHHYHDSKVEKFFVVRGFARFEMINLINNKKISFLLNHNQPKVIESIPGYIHKIKNIGKSEAIVFLWSNEIFNVNKPDTFQIWKN